MTDKTRAELQAEVGALTERLEQATVNVPRAPVAVPEANAVAQCVRALDAMQETLRGRTDQSYSYGYGSNTPAERVLRFLAEKYGVELIQTRYEPCARTHVDQLDPLRVVDVLRSAVSS